MNILPHKSWHVYNKKNIEKVRKDEEKAKEEERAKQARVTLAESEARLSILRKRAEERSLTTSTESQSVVKHVNLFEDLKGSTTNEERDAEEKEKNEKWERQITMYLDKDKDNTPWYAGARSSDDKYRDTHVKKFQYKDEQHKKRRREPIDLKDDPLALVNSLLKEKENKKKPDHHRHRHHRSGKDTKEHKSSKEHKVSHKSGSSSKKSSSIEALRAQRLEREREERQRVNELILGHSINDEEEQESKGGYHSQFNPDETRKAKAKRHKRY